MYYYIILFKQIQLVYTCPAFLSFLDVLPLATAASYLLCAASWCLAKGVTAGGGLLSRGGGVTISSSSTACITLACKQHS